MFFGVSNNVKEHGTSQSRALYLRYMFMISGRSYFFAPSGLPPLSDSRICVSAWMFWNL